MNTLLDFFIETFSIKGRMWVRKYLILFFANLALYFFFISLFIILPIFEDVFIYGLITGAVYFYSAYWCLKTRRLHDLGISWFFTIPILIFEWIPILGLIIWWYTSFFSWTVGPNKFWPHPRDIEKIDRERKVMIFAFIVVWINVIFLTILFARWSQSLSEQVSSDMTTVFEANLQAKVEQCMKKVNSESSDTYNDSLVAECLEEISNSTR